MKIEQKNWIITTILIVFLCSFASAGIPRRNLGFNFYWEGDVVEIVGNFRGGSDIVRLPMMKVSERHWTITLKLRPGFYHYRYLLSREHWRQCPFIEDRILVDKGPLPGNFTLLKVYPVEYEDFLVLAEELKEQGKYEWARDVLHEAVKKFPEKEEVYIKLGHIYEEIGQLGLAVDAYTAAMEKFPVFPEARYHLALALEELYADTGKSDFKVKARQQWMWLLEKGHYRRQAREYLQ